MRVKKSVLLTAIILLLPAVAALWIWLSPKAATPDTVAKSFLTSLYTADAARFEAVSAKLTALASPSDGQVGTAPIPNVMKSYEAIYSPLLTEKGFEAFFASGYPLLVDQYAFEHQATFAVTSVALTPDSEAAELVQYRYKVEVAFTDSYGTRNFSPEGSITIDTSGGKALVNSFKPFDKPLLAWLK